MKIALKYCNEVSVFRYFPLLKGTNSNMTFNSSSGPLKGLLNKNQPIKQQQPHYPRK